MTNTTAINPERLQRIAKHSLKANSHSPNEPNGHFSACFLEAAAWVAGESWTDHPECVCPVIGAFGRSWNDSLRSDAERDRLLKPLIPLVLNTRSTPDIERRRSLMAADWLVRVHTPAWLRAAKLEDQAKLLEALPEITDMAQCPSLMPALLAVRKDAAAARDAAWDAAWDAAGAAARAAAWAAAGAAARDAAWDAAWDAAGAAAGAAGAAVAPTVARLQDSAADLVRRMCELKSEAAQ